jgi:hypothetical protein
VFLGVVALGGRRVERIGESSNRLSGVAAGPEARLWRLRPSI